jgi:hypothetical protein
MKPLKHLMLGLVLTLFVTSAFSQEASKPKNFADFPDNISCSVFEFHNAFSAREGQKVELAFANNFKFSGTVLYNITKYNNLQTMTIKSDEFENTIFHLSKQMIEGNPVSFVGRITSPNAADGFQVRKGSAGNYILEKTESHKVLQECHL